MNFSQRKGLKPAQKIIQLNSIDDDLKNSLWNALTIFYWDSIGDFISYSSTHENLMKKIWMHHFKINLALLEDHWASTFRMLQKRFYVSSWDEIYSFIEFVANEFDHIHINRDFMKSCNKLLERENSAYRFVNGQISEIANEDEIKEIENAVSLQGKWGAAKIHIQSSLDKLSDRKSPDPRNSIKESISAVEAVCKIITNNPTATLSDALGVLKKEKQIELHPALSKALSHLYGYAGDEGGIRHALLDEKIKLDKNDARFMLIACSAFVNFLISKTEI